VARLGRGAGSGIALVEPDPVRGAGVSRLLPCPQAHRQSHKQEEAQEDAASHGKGTLEKVRQVIRSHLMRLRATDARGRSAGAACGGGGQSSSVTETSSMTGPQASSVCMSV